MLTDEPNVKRKPFVYAWASEPFTRFLDWQEEANKILHVSMRGMSVLRGIPQAVEVLANVQGEKVGEEAEIRLERARAEAALAEREVQRGFPLLHGQAAVSLWGALEDLITVFLTAWMKNVPESLQVDAVRRLKIPLSDYLAKSADEQYEYLVGLLSESLGGSQRYGVNRFEALLAPFGLSGEVDPKTARNIYTLQQIRHVLVHRRGVADRRLVDGCPGLVLAVGDEVTLSHEMFGELSAAVGEYVLELIQRVRVHFGAGRYEPAQSSKPPVESN